MSTTTPTEQDRIRLIIETFDACGGRLPYDPQSRLARALRRVTHEHPGQPRTQAMHLHADLAYGTELTIAERNQFRAEIQKRGRAT